MSEGWYRTLVVLEGRQRLPMPWRDPIILKFCLFGLLGRT